MLYLFTFKVKQQMQYMIEAYKKSWQKEDVLDVSMKVVAFLISPFLSFIYSLRRINTRSSFLVFFLFALMYGLCFTVVADNLSIYETADAARWRFRFENTYLYTFNDYIEYCSEYFQFAGTDIRDLYIGTLFYLVHKISDNYHIFFLVAAFVFSFFQLKSLRFLVSSPSFDNSVICLFICALFCMNTIANIGVLRHTTATWMCVYSVLQIFYNKKRSYLVLLLILPLIHRGFFFMYPILLLSISHRYKNMWTRLYFASFVFSTFSIYIIRDATNYLPAFLSHMIEAYTEDTTFEQYSFTKSFLRSMSMIYVNVLFVLIMNASKTYLPANIKPLYQFTLVLISVVNFVIPIPSLGGRFFTIAQVLIAFLWLNMMGTKSKYNILIYLMPLFMVRPFYMVFYRNFTRFQDLSFFYTNPIELIYSHLSY